MLEKDQIYRDELRQMQRKAEEDKIREREELAKCIQEQQDAIQQGFEDKAADMEQAMSLLKQQELENGKLL